jgi:dihydrodipicolinate synthase/N-acetylneuraminate lyase
MSEAGRFRGLFPIVQTPFTAEGAVDFDSLRRLVRHVCGRAEGLTFPGFASEFWRLTEEEILGTDIPDTPVVLQSDRSPPISMLFT